VACDCDHQNPPSVLVIELTPFYWCDEQVMNPDGAILQIGVANSDAAKAIRKTCPTMRHLMVEASHKNAEKFGAINIALAASRGPVKLYLGYKAYQHTTLKMLTGCIGFETVSGLTLTDILDEFDLPEVDLVLCNCEGSELHAIRQLAGPVGNRIRQACMALHCSHVQYYSRQILDATLLPLTDCWDMDFRMPQGLEYVLLTRK